MTASRKMIEALNQQVGNETFASLQYTSLAAYFDGESLLTLSRFFEAQADEEREHAMKFVHFIMAIGAPLEIPAIPAPRHSVGSAEKGVALALEGERTVTGQIHDLMLLAMEEKDLYAQQFLQWFVDEQQEEENRMQDLLGVIRLSGDRILDVEAFLVREGWVSKSAGEAGGE